MAMDIFEIFFEILPLQVSLAIFQQKENDRTTIKNAPAGDQRNGYGVHNQPKNIIARNKAR